MGFSSPQCTFTLQFHADFRVLCIETKVFPILWLSSNLSIYYWVFRMERSTGQLFLYFVNRRKQTIRKWLLKMWLSYCFFLESNWQSAVKFRFSAGEHFPAKPGVEGGIGFHPVLNTICLLHQEPNCQPISNCGILICRVDWRRQEKQHWPERPR